MHTKTHMWGRRCERGVRALRACAHGASICVPSGVIPNASSHVTHSHGESVHSRLRYFKKTPHRSGIPRDAAQAS